MERKAEDAKVWAPNTAPWLMQTMCWRNPGTGAAAGVCDVVVTEESTN